MADPELDEIRARRMAQLRGEGGQKDAAGMEERQKQQEEMKHGLLTQILDQAARARLNTLLVVKPEKGRQVESLLISMAQRGQLPGKLGEKELINILEQISGSLAQSKGTVKFDRRRAALDSDDDDDL